MLQAECMSVRMDGCNTRTKFTEKRIKFKKKKDKKGESFACMIYIL